MAKTEGTLTGLEEQLRAIVVAEMAYTPSHPLEPATPLFETLLDSTSVLALASTLEEQFQIQIEDRELVPANFSTLRQLAAYIERKTRPAATQSAANG